MPPARGQRQRDDRRIGTGVEPDAVFLRAASGSSATIAWTGSAPTARSPGEVGSAVDANPTTGTDTTRDAASGGRPDRHGQLRGLRGGRQTGLVTVTGLSAGTTYHCALYLQRRGSFLNYKTSSPARAA
jgi:hypothetical protein